MVSTSISECIVEQNHDFEAEDRADEKYSTIILILFIVFGGLK